MSRWKGQAVQHGIWGGVTKINRKILEKSIRKYPCASNSFQQLPSLVKAAKIQGGVRIRKKGSIYQWHWIPCSQPSRGMGALESRMGVKHFVFLGSSSFASEVLRVFSGIRIGLAPGIENIKYEIIRWSCFWLSLNNESLERSGCPTPAMPRNLRGLQRLIGKSLIKALVKILVVPTSSKPCKSCQSPGRSGN